MIVTNPTQMYDLHAQERYQAHVTGGRHLVTPGINGILPFLAPAWVALLAVPFDFFGTDIGGRRWVLFCLPRLGRGPYPPLRPTPPRANPPSFPPPAPPLAVLYSAPPRGRGPGVRPPHPVR